MAQQDVRISFFDDVVDAIERFLIQHEDHTPLRNDLERALVVSYLLAVLRRDVDALLEVMSASDVFGSTDPLALFEESVPDRDECDKALRREARQRAIEMGWLPRGSHGIVE